MKILNKKMLAFIFVVAFAILMPFGNVKAALQSNPNTHYRRQDTINNMMFNIRSMEKSGNAMGLNEILNSDLTASTESNGIDVHMMKSTEYGAVAILSASGYGNPSILQNSSVKTTTGNKTGVYFNGTDWEFVAGASTQIRASNSKYYNLYTSGTPESAKTGDALGTSSVSNPGCAKWHSTASVEWVSGGNGQYFIRGGSGLFGFKATYGTSNGPYFARGVAIVGAGI